jgi:glycosyltransferase involved in cell wall biosynthesis
VTASVVAEPPFVSVVVPARNAARTLADCLRALLRQDYPAERREILVVDNGSTDGTARLISQFPVIHLAEPRRGPSHARNHGIRASRGEIVAFIDADCVATSRWLPALVAGFDAADVAGVAGEVLAYPPHSWAEYYMARRRPRWQEAALAAVRPYVVTANVAVRRRVFDEIGLFDPRFVTGQDQDFSWRFFGAGLRMRYAPAAVVFHRHRAGPWAFVRQQIGWARGAALLRRHHRVPRGLADELAEYRELGRVTGRLLRALPGAAVGRADRPELYYRLYDALREFAYRVATLSCAVEAAGRRLIEGRGSARPDESPSPPQPGPAAPKRPPAASQMSGPGAASGVPRALPRP